MRVLVTGCGGQLGWELLRTAPAGYTVIGKDRSSLDITDPKATQTAVDDLTPDLIINAAAYTAVDKAESEKDMAYAVNETGVANLAYAAKRSRARLIHISTDFVFDGKNSVPYGPNDAPCPLNVYGKSKLAGEEAALSILPDSCLIVRTSWVYSAHGKNFVKTMLRLMKEREALSVVADQIGTPCWARQLASAIWTLAPKEISGILNLGDAGIASWYDFAVAIKEEALAAGLLKNNVSIVPIKTEDYPTQARRPLYSVLDKQMSWKLSKIDVQHWRESLRHMLAELKENKNV